MIAAGCQQALQAALNSANGTWPTRSSAAGAHNPPVHPPSIGTGARSEAFGDSSPLVPFFPEIASSTASGFPLFCLCVPRP